MRPDAPFLLPHTSEVLQRAEDVYKRQINDIMRMEYRGLLSMPEIIPASSMQQLSNDGISFIKKSDVYKRQVDDSPIATHIVCDDTEPSDCA